MDGTMKMIARNADHEGVRRRGGTAGSRDGGGPDGRGSDHATLGTRDGVVELGFR